jgi:hypothetical protein
MREDAETSPEDVLRRWLGEDPSTVTVADDHTGKVRGRVARRVGVALLAVLPWVALALAIASSGGGPAPGTHVTGTHPSGQPTAAADARPTGDGTAVTAEGGGGHRVPAGVGPTALRLVRDAVTRTGARTSALDTGAVERPTPVATELWLVRVHAVVLRGDRARWRSADHEVWVVPVGRRGDALVGLEQPWRVATGAARTATTAWRPTTVDAGAARTALRRVGIVVDRIHAQRHPRVRTIVRVRTGRRWVWLRTTPRLTVLGVDPAVAS